jgi:inorganic pyrophosphatase
MAADGDAVDCYLITGTSPAAGTVVECQPFGLLCQEENGEADHKILARLAGETTPPSDELLHRLGGFIEAIFAAEPGTQVRVGPILPLEAALHHLQSGPSC